MHITPLYASLLSLLFLGLAARVIVLRNKHQVAIGDGDSKALRRARRAHANFAEYVPLTLLLMFFVEMQLKSTWWIHLMGGALLLGRGIHAYGLSQVKEDLRLRITGMTLTLTVLGAAALTLIVFQIIRFAS